MSITLTPHTFCPSCGYTLTAAGTSPATADADARPPAPGDYTVCMRCRTVLTYTNGLGVRILTNAEWAALSPEARADLTETRAAIARMQAATGWPGQSNMN